MKQNHQWKKLTTIKKLISWLWNITIDEKDEESLFDFHLFFKNKNINTKETLDLEIRN